jgi:hypothetical protein
MKLKDFSKELKFNDEGCLPRGIYQLTLGEVENHFVDGKSQRRRDIFEEFKVHLMEIQETGCCLNHWIDGSFVTLKENPGDIDTLTEFDGVKVDELGIRDRLEDLIYNAPLRTNGSCHSLMVIKYPKDFEELYEQYLYFKSNILIMLFCRNKETKNPKGFIELRR